MRDWTRRGRRSPQLRRCAVQLRTVLVPIADALRASGIPDAQRMADQLTGLVAVTGGAADEQATAGVRGLRVGAELLSVAVAAVFAILTLASLACTALAVALSQLAGRAGIVVMAVLVGAAAIFGGRRDLASDSEFVRRLLPSSYAVTALGEAAHTGIDGALIRPVAVLLAVGVVSVCCTVFVSRRAQN
ncbi:hypothetical protein [Nocardia sp. NPDC050412]|uniref:hypothetical protein n=1 Tax=Nocardia sp. NPDC050412 TaxID=3364320 RepID=UPI0037B07C5D